MKNNVTNGYTADYMSGQLTKQTENFGDNLSSLGSNVLFTMLVAQTWCALKSNACKSLTW